MLQRPNIAFFMIIFFVVNEIMQYPDTAFNFHGISATINVTQITTTLPESKFRSLFKMNQTFTNKRSNLIIFYGEKMKDYVSRIMPYIDLIKEQSNHFHGNYVHAKRMYVSGGFSITDEEIVYQDPDRENHIHIVANIPGDVVGQYENVLLVGHYYCYVFAHFINEIMTPTLLFPEEIRKKSYLVVKGSPIMWRDITRVLGFQDRTIPLGNNEWIYCENLYTVIQPRPHGGYYGPAIYNLHLLFRNAFNLTHIDPTKIGFLNRKGPNRVISNFAVLKEAAEKKYPNEAFFTIPDTLTACDAAKVFASCRILMTATGSSCINAIYMADNTAIIKITGPSIDFCNIMVPNSLSLYQIHLLYPGMTMYTPSVTTLDINESMKALDMAFYVTEKQKWPTINEYSFII